MELYKRNHPYKHRRNSHQETTKHHHPYSNIAQEQVSPTFTFTSTMEILNSNAPESGCGSHHRLHCPGAFECDHCSSSSRGVNTTTTTTTATKIPPTTIADQDFNSSPTSLIINDEQCGHLNLNLIHMHSRGKHLDFSCGCGCCEYVGTNYKDHNDNGVKTLANCCDTLGNTLTHVEVVHKDQPRIRSAATATTATATLMRWRDGFLTCINRCMPLLSGRPLPRRRTRSLVLNSQWIRMTSFLYTFAIVLITCFPNLPVSYACSSRSTPKPRPPSPTLRPNITMETYTCPPEYDAHYCLNGATCFTVKIGESILYNCECAEGYMGQRCEFKDLDGSYLPSKQRAMLEQAGVSGAVAIVIILVVIVVGYVYVRQTRRRALARHAREAGDQVDGFVVERRPFSQYYYNNPSISISQDLHQQQSRSTRGVRGDGDGTSLHSPLQVPSSNSGQSRPPPDGQPHDPSPSHPAGPVALHTTKKSKPPDPSRRQT